MSIKQKIKNLWKNHKEEIIAGGVILGCVGIGIACDHYEKKSKISSVEEVPSPASENIDIPETPKLPEWEPRYMKNWNTMVELAQRLELEPGESYVIDDAGLSKHSGVIIGNGNNAISHYINGYECYPDEDWWERYINGDTYHTNDNPESKIARLIYAMNGTVLDPGECYHYGIDSDNKIFTGISKNNFGIDLLKKAYNSERLKGMSEDELHKALFDVLASSGFDIVEF